MLLLLVGSIGNLSICLLSRPLSPNLAEFWLHQRRITPRLLVPHCSSHLVSQTHFCVAFKFGTQNPDGVSLLPEKRTVCSMPQTAEPVSRITEYCSSPNRSASFTMNPVLACPLRAENSATTTPNLSERVIREVPEETMVTNRLRMLLLYMGSTSEQHPKVTTSTVTVDRLAHTNVGSGHSQGVRVDFSACLSICAFSARRGRVPPLAPPTVSAVPLPRGRTEPTRASDLDIQTNDNENDSDSDNEDDNDDHENVETPEKTKCGEQNIQSVFTFCGRFFPDGRSLSERQHNKRNSTPRGQKHDTNHLTWRRGFLPDGRVFSLHIGEP